MILSDLPPSCFKPFTALFGTAGFSGDARYVDESATQSWREIKRSHSLDDGRKQLQTALAGQLEDCSRPGWDGYGAEPVTQETYRQAWLFVEALPQGFPMPSVGAEADGHLTLEWYHNPSRVVSVSISPDGDLHYAALVGNTARRNGTEPFLGDVPPDLLGIIRRVLQT